LRTVFHFGAAKVGPFQNNLTVTPRLNLVVLRSSDIDRAMAFYSKLGLHFTKHRHGTGAEHYSAELGGAVFELYPENKGGPSSLGTRIGFAVSSVDESIRALADYPTAVVSPAKDSEWGRRAIVSDPDGHRIELLQIGDNLLD
jgi:lactoylglutathione lyase